MYCPTCGVENVAGLRFCKGCGESLFGPTPLNEAPPKVVRTTGAVWAVALATVAITLAGLGIVFTYAYEIMRPSHWGSVPQPTPEGYIPVSIVMIVFGSATLFGIVYLLLKLFTKLMHLPLDSERASKRSHSVGTEYRVNQLQGPPMQMPPMPHMPSVTEHTTRNFGPLRSGEQRGPE